MTISTEWGIYVEPDRAIEHNHCIRNYFCRECGQYTGLMHTRSNQDASDSFHREYKIVCTQCAQSTSVHLSKNLAENCWKAANPNSNEDYISRNVADMIRKGR